MVLGARQRFAIESNIYAKTQSHLLGNLCIWAQGKRIGEYERSLVLDGSASVIENFLALPGRRSHWTLDDKTDEEIINIVIQSRYSELDTSSVETAYPVYERYAGVYKAIEVCPSLSPAFDGDKAVLLEDTNSARFIWQAFGEDAVNKVVLALGECQNVLAMFVAWVHTEGSHRSE